MLYTCITIPASFYLYKVKILLLSGVAESSEKFTCSTSGEGIKRAEVKSTASFKLCIIPSTQKSMAIEAELKHVIHHSVIKCTITHGGEREYEVAYKPEIRGRHTLSLKIDSHEIQSSPFAVFVHCPAYKLGQSLRTIPDTSSPQLSRPLGIALGICGSESLIVVCDSGKGSVSVLNREGNQIQEILPGGTPHGIAGGKDGSWYITLTDLHKIQKFTHEGVFIKGVGGKGSKPAQFKKPKGVAVNRGLVHVCDSGNSRVQIFDSDLNFVSSFGQKGSGPMSLMSPVDAAFDGSGHIYVADSLRNRVIQFSPKYLYIKTFGDERSASCKLNCPQGVCVGPNDVVYVTDCDHCVSVYQASGKLLANFGGRGGEVGRFSHPCGIAVDDDGFVYVSDRDNGRIQVF